MDTTEALKRAMQALRDAAIPESLWPTALPLALEDLRSGGAPAGAATKPHAPAPLPPAGKVSKSKPKKSNGTPRQATAAAASTPSVLAGIPDEQTFFSSIEKETGASVTDLSDIFHIENGQLQLKVAAKDLGTGPKHGTQTITALLGGAVFAGTSHRKLPFAEIHEVCKAKHFFNQANAASYIKGTPGFSAVTNPLALTTKSGWQVEFIKTINRVLKKPVTNP